MPESIFLMRWSAKRGPVVQGSYPPETELKKDFLIDILGSIIQEEEERTEGFYPITLEGKDIISYYSGEELQQVFGIVLKEAEREQEYRGGLVQATARILKKGGSISTSEEWSNLWSWIVNYPDMSREHRIRDAFRDASMNIILSIMAESGILTMDELVDRAGIRTTLSRDVITTYAHILEALGLLETHWDEEALEERVYMIRDLLYYREKPQNHEKISKNIPQYRKNVNNYLEKYNREMIWKEDRETLPQLLSQPSTYNLLQRFENQGLIKKTNLEEGSIEESNKLLQRKIIEEDQEYFYFFTTPKLDLIFPKFTISRVLARARDEELSRNDVIDYLQTLRDSYL